MTGHALRVADHESEKLVKLLRAHGGYLGVSSR